MTTPAATVVCIRCRRPAAVVPSEFGVNGVDAICMHCVRWAPISPRPPPGGLLEHRKALRDAILRPRDG